MKFYEPIEGLLERRRRTRRTRVTFSVAGIIALGLLLYWGLSAYRNAAAEARTDRIISLSSPDFTHVLVEADAGTADGGSQADSGAVGSRTASVPAPEFVDGEIQRNQTLFVAMREAGVDPASIQAVVDALDGTFNFRRARPGDLWEARLDEEGQIVRFRYTVSPEEIYEAERVSGGGYESGRVDVPTETVVAGLGGTVVSSVYDAVAGLGEGTQLASLLLEVFGWDIDFSRDVRPGDTFKILVEKVFLDGQFLRYGRVLAVEYTGRAGTLRAFAHVDAGGVTRYYTAAGDSLQRNFLRAPLNYRRISSPFSRRRFHPVLHRYRPHLGIDYAASTGTPVWSVADGEVSYAGYRGANGNLVVIRHDDDYESLYAHLSRIADGVRRGRQVRQGEIIGYVGSTGLSTGPHLHFGMREDGEYVDPASVEATRGAPLRGEDLTAFQADVARYGRELDAIAISPVDLSDVAIEPELESASDPGDFTGVEEDILLESD